jgi:type II secretory pathway component PulK
VVLLIVLVVVVMLALGAFTFTQLMVMEGSGAKNYGRLVQAREAADGGVHYVAAVLADQKRYGVLGLGLYDNAELFRDVAVSEVTPGDPSGGSWFSVVAPRDDELARGGESIRFGLVDESARLNVNGWLYIAALIGNSPSGQSTTTGAVGSSTTSQSNSLLYLPNMTRDIADAMLDWVDPDDDPRPYGAEGGDYGVRDPPYKARNGAMATLDELLLIRGVTPRLLYGEDANLNGVLDPNEDDGERSYPKDNADGVLDRGWLTYLSVYSHDSNTDKFGRTRIDLNSQDVEALYNQLRLEPDFDDEHARFIVAYRLFGAAPAGGQGPSDTHGTGGGSGTGSGTGSAKGTTGSRTGTRSASDSNASAADASQNEGNASGSQTNNVESRSKIVAGFDASRGGDTQFQSPLDLIDAVVEARLADSETTERIESPFQMDQASIDALIDRTTIWSVADWVGQLNVNTAPRESLLALPGLTEDRVDAIISARARRDGDSGQIFNGGLAWLLTDGVMTLAEFKALETYITGRGQVFRVQVIGYSEGYGNVSRVDAMIDMTGSAPRIRLWRDLTSLGGGATLRRLATDQGSLNVRPNASR